MRLIRNDFGFVTDGGQHYPPLLCQVPLIIKFGDFIWLIYLKF